MSETFFLYLVALIFSFVLGICSIWWVGMANATKKYIEESKKLQLKLNQAKAIVNEYSENPKDFIGGAMGDMGVDGIIDALGIPAIFKPIAKGFVDNLMKDPEKLQGLLKKIGVDVNVTSEQKDSVPSQM